MSGEELEKPCSRGDDFFHGSPAYNAPAGVFLNVQKKCLPDLFVDLSFLYYYASQEGMNLATSGELYNAVSGTPWLNIETANGTLLSQDFAYKPAFQIGLGANFSEWTLEALYTWIRQTTTTYSLAPTPSPAISGIGSWVVNSWVEQFTSTGRVNSGPYLTSTWELGMDIVDLVAGRPYYQGINLTLSPSFGLRAAWIREHLNLDLSVSSLVTVLANAGNNIIYSTTSSNSWGIGPIASVQTSCLMGRGFRLETNVQLASLYTTYTTLKHSENIVSTSPYTGELAVEQNDTLHFLRPELCMSLGLGWGAYFCNQKYHLDLFLGYDFNLFWGQNMLRAFMDEIVTGIGAAPGNLTLQGLNIRMRFNF